MFKLLCIVNILTLFLDSTDSISLNFRGKALSSYCPENGIYSKISINSRILRKSSFSVNQRWPDARHPCLRRSGYARADKILKNEAYLEVLRNKAPPWLTRSKMRVTPSKGVFQQLVVTLDNLDGPFDKSFRKDSLERWIACASCLRRIPHEVTVQL